jgi:hypothetical protein
MAVWWVIGLLQCLSVLEVASQDPRGHVPVPDPVVHRTGRVPPANNQISTIFRRKVQL